MGPSESPGSAPYGRLIVRLGSNAHAVSALSSTLRTLHAAVRETAGRTGIGEDLFESRPAPILTAEIASADGGLQLSLFFGDREGQPLDDASHKAFGAFMEELIAAVTADSQPTLWETNARIRPRPANQRLRLFIDDAIRLRNADIAASGRRVRISDTRIDVAPD